MTEAPPPRYRVIEDGRRLVVIDNWGEDGRPGPQISSPPDAPANPPDRLRRPRVDGSAELHTHPLYDANGPRLIRLGPDSAGLIKAARGVGIAVVVAIVVAVVVSPWLLLPILFIGFQARAKLRQRFTGWLDMIAQEAG